MADIRPRKRQKGEDGASTKINNDGDDEERELLRLLDGDDKFVSRESQEAQSAQARRALRKQKLAAIEEQRRQAASGQVEIQQEQQRNGVTDTTINTESSTSKQNLESTGGGGEGDKEAQEEGKEEDEFDMFSSSVSPVTNEGKVRADNADVVPLGNSSSNKRGHEQSDWDDAEGYYKAVIGEMIELQHMAAGDAAGEEEAVGKSTVMRFKVAGVVGKGVFSTVLKCATVSNTSSVELPPECAMKFVRHNETMAKAAANEIKFLQQLQGSRGVVPLLLPTGSTHSSLEYRGHVILAFPYFEYNLRDVLQKFGKGVGLTLSACRSYFGQLLAAATHLKKHGIIHADLKPPNILVSGDFSTVQLADFGSAFEASAPENQPTLYLVSRFYRAPEIILGLVPTIAIDLWSLAVTIAEVFLGDVVFRGRSNNDMLFVFMQHLGPFSNRVIRQHMVQCQKMPNNSIPRQFKQEGTHYVFTQNAVDPISGEPVHKILPLVAKRSDGSGATASPKFPLATPLHAKILKAKSPTDTKTSVLLFIDLLEKCLALDPSRRLALKDSLQHQFFQTT